MKNSKRRAQRSGRRSKRRSGPRTLEEFRAMPDTLQDQWVGTVNAVSKMRAAGLSLPQAAREFGLDFRTLARKGASALRQGRNGRYVAKASDRLFRSLLVLTREGSREIGTRDSRQATLVAEHWNAVHRYLETGDVAALQKFRRKRLIDADGKRVSLLTDTAEIDRYGSAGVLSFETIYARTA